MDNLRKEHPENDFGNYIKDWCNNSYDEYKYCKVHNKMCRSDVNLYECKFISIDAKYLKQFFDKFNNAI